MDKALKARTTAVNKERVRDIFNDWNENLKRPALLKKKSLSNDCSNLEYSPLFIYDMIKNRTPAVLWPFRLKRVTVHELAH